MLKSVLRFLGETVVGGFGLALVLLGAVGGVTAIAVMVDQLYSVGMWIFPIGFGVVIVATVLAKVGIAIMQKVWA